MVTITKSDDIQVIKTSDFTLASTLLCLGHDIIGIDKTDKRRVVFYYRHTSDLEVLVQQFRLNQVKVNPKEFAFAQREIKARIYTDET